jgi:FkbM family methyltransferase
VADDNRASAGRRPFLLRLVRRGRRLPDPVLSYLELRATDLELRARTTHGERLMLLASHRALTKPNSVVYDVGAATGVYAAAFAKVRTVSEVIAFEPLADSFAELEKRARESSVVRCFRLALGDEPGLMALQRSAWRDTSSFLPISDRMRAEFPSAAEIEGPERVEVARLDDVVAEQDLPLPDVLKMDVQGFEDRVIRGGSATLRSARLCVVEVSFRPLYEGSALFDDVYLAMRELGFALSAIDSPLSSRSGELLQANAIFEPATLGEPSARAGDA